MTSTMTANQNGTEAHRPPPEIRMEWVLVTPVLAAMWLQNNPHNRNLNPNTVKQIANTMLAGRWREDAGGTIARTHDGRLVNGQHRLSAIVETGMSFYFVLLTGVPMEAQIAIDIPQRRNLAQALTWMGETNVNVLGAALQQLYAYYNLTGLIGPKIQPANRPDYSVLLEILSLNPGIRESINATYQARTQLRIPSGPASAMHYVTHGWSPADADGFWDRLATGVADGVGLDEDDPIFVVRRVILNNIASAHKMTDNYKMAIVTKAWNLWIAGEKRSLIRWSTGGVASEPFPTLKPPT